MMAAFTAFDGSDEPQPLTFEGIIDASGRQGPGIMHYPNGTTVEGVFENNACIHGVRKEPGRLVYTGPLDEHDRPDGYGKVKTRLGTKLQGTFSHGVLVEGHYKDSLGNWYDGSFENKKFGGPGGIFFEANTERLWDVEHWHDGKPAGPGSLYLEKQEVTGTWTDFYSGSDFVIYNKGEKCDFTSAEIAQYLAEIKTR